MIVYRIFNSANQIVGTTVDSGESKLFLSQRSDCHVVVENDPFETGTSRLPALQENPPAPQGGRLTQ